MNIYDLKVNHKTNPIGIGGESHKFSFKATEGNYYKIHLYEDNQSSSLYTQSVDGEDRSHVYIDYPFKKGIRYSWCVEGDMYMSERAYFEIAEDLDTKFITSHESVAVPKFSKKFTSKAVKCARLYITGLGLYRAFINGKKVGQDYLTPFFNDYDDYVRYQTYDITDSIERENMIEVIVGDGWYKGRIGIDGHGGDTYGSKYIINAKIKLIYEDGSEKIIGTDKTWTCQESVIIETSIYDGEIRNDLNTAKEAFEVKVVPDDYNLIPDFSSPIREKLVLKPELIVSPSGQKILDFKQNMVGVCSFVNRLQEGNRMKLSFGEVLQKGEFYNDNYRTAKSIYEYVSDGVEKEVEPFFTFYGFRYVLVEGLEHVNPEDFKGIVLYSDLDATLKVSTSHYQLDRLMKNALWGQRGNFLDVPTDCPQRDERLGWTADAQVFVNTACYHMDSFNFYKKYVRDLRYDQVTYYNGDLPMYSPSLKKSTGYGGAVWSDAATIIPWNLYQAYGDKTELANQYPLMADYVETLISKDEANNNTHIITEGFTFGDWLAQDGICDQSMKGGTNDTYIKSMYYYRSLTLTAYAAEIIGKQEASKRYLNLAQQVKAAIFNEFFTMNGRLSIDTQTAYILALMFEVYPQKQRIVDGLKERLKKDLYKIKSGFVGTPLFLPTLFENGMEEEAYRLLFNEELPGWFYAINLGATTIWERWNSLNPDGSISGVMMNSMNHYAFGSVCEAIYAYVAGLKSLEPGWKKVEIAPRLSHHLNDIALSFESPIGLYEVKWRRDKTGNFELNITIPYGGEAYLKLPDYEGSYNSILKEGSYQYKYALNKDYTHPYSEYAYVLDVLNHPEAAAVFKEICPQAYAIVSGENKEFTIMRVMELQYLDMFGVSSDMMKQLSKSLAKIEV